MPAREGGRYAEVYADATAVLPLLAKALLEECGKARPGANRGELRYLWLQALRALSKRSLLKDEDLIPLLRFAEARKVGNESLKQQLRTMVEALVGDAAAGLVEERHVLGAQRVERVAVDLLGEEQLAQGLERGVVLVAHAVQLAVGRLGDPGDRLDLLVARVRPAQHPLHPEADVLGVELTVVPAVPVPPQAGGWASVLNADATTPAD